MRVPYPHLWDGWETNAAEHVAALRARHGVKLAELEVPTEHRRYLLRLRGFSVPRAA